MSQPKRREKGELACDPCRQLKVKCRRDPEDETICQKCKRHNVNCTWSEIRVRRRKPSTKSVARIQALEAKIDQLLSAVEDKDRASTELRSSSDVNTPSSKTSILSPTPDGHVTILGVLNEKFGLTEQRAEEYLEFFRSMALYLPFVIIPSSTSISRLAQSRPMLCLAVLTASSMQDRELQISLEAMLRKELAEAIIVNQEKNLDILAAILVFLGWSHFYHMPKRDSMGQFMALAISICEELGLGLTKEEAVTRQFRHRLDHCEEGAEEISAEAKRLYLGVYFVINTYNWSFAEPSKVPDWEFSVRCAEELGARDEYATDALVSCLVKMQSVALRFHYLFVEYASAEFVDPLQLAAQLDEAEESMVRLKNELPPILRDSALTELTQYHLLIYAYEADLINPMIRGFTPPKNPSHQLAMTMILSRCLLTVRNYLEAFLTLPATEYPRMSFDQWKGQTYALVMLYKMSINIPRVPMWDVYYTRSTVPLEFYMEHYIQTMRMALDLTGHSTESQDHRDLYFLYHHIWRDTLNAYFRKRDNYSGYNAESSSLEVHQKTLSDNHKRGHSAARITSSPKRAAHPCPAFAVWK